MTNKNLLKRRIDTYNNLISRLDRITSANYMHIVAGMRCTLKAMIDNNLAIIDSTQENPCNVCTNRKGCVTCENGELWETIKEKPKRKFFEGMKDGTKRKQLITKDLWEYECQVEEGGMSPFTVDGSIPVLTNTDMILLPKDKFKVGDKVKLIIIKK